jgi:hypothetical protein
MTLVYRNQNGLLLEILLGFLLLTTAARAQCYTHYTFWSRVQVQKRFSPRFDLVAEFQYRQQNDLHLRVQTPFDRPFARIYRLVGSYRRGPWSFQINPSYFYNYQLLGKEQDYKTPANPEWRMAVYAEWSRTWGRFNLRLRPGYEYRLQQRDDYAPTGRARFRVQSRLTLGQHLRGIVSEELLLNVAPNAGPVLFNQNQAYAGLDFDLYKTWLGLEVGYLNVYRQRRTRVEFDDEHALNVQVKIRL